MTVTCATCGWRESAVRTSSATRRSSAAERSFDQRVQAAAGTSSMPRGTTSEGIAPGGSVGASSAIFAFTRTTAWSGSVPTTNLTMTMPPEGCEVE
jgi:hypothetical protein